MTRPTTATATRPGMLSAFAATTGLLLVLVLVQAAMAGQALFEGFDIEIHGYVGNASFVVGLVALGLAVVGRMSLAPFAFSVATAAALFAQTGLGYVGRETSLAASIHVPLGVAIFGLVAVQLTLGLLLHPRTRARFGV